MTSPFDSVDVIETEPETSYVTDQPTWNLKCIVLTLLLAGGYWYLPKRNKWILLALLFFPYLALAWYDYWYACERNMGPTYLSLFYKWFKPQDSDQIRAYENWDPEIKRKVWAVDLVLAVVLIALAPWFWHWKPK